ncbi:MAG: family 10 glycosylhydrolase [Clostridia bacterium]|nr:family 10 glycosylhydrolase [Clostridia bacterium]
MKKLLCVVLMLMQLCGCVPIEKSAEQGTDRYITGVWVSFYELDGMLKGDFKAEFNAAVQNCKSRGIGDMFVCVRPHCDAVYRSKWFPLRDSAAGYNFDVLEYMIELCHQNNICFHAWINPYRVCTTDNDVTKLPADSPVKKLLSEKDISTENGIYLNPASQKVRALIIDGVREIINKYDVDGIHFDDYFYPSTSESFDASSYADYCANTDTPLPLADWRRANINALIGGVYTAVKFKDKDLLFSVSPSASIEDNYNKQYADIAAWVDSGCVDLIIPQLYFGFDYPDPAFKFDNLLNDWLQLAVGKQTRLAIGLATYKINTQSEPDRTEWANGTDVINRQTKICKQNGDISGHIFFSYSSMVQCL